MKKEAGVKEKKDKKTQKKAGMLHCLCYNEYGFPRPDNLSRRFRLGRTFHFGIRFEKQAEVNQAANADNAVNDPGDCGIVPKNSRHQIKVEKTDKAPIDRADNREN
jgi:hypothetical protein